MPFQAVPNVAQIVLEGLVDNQLTVNDLYFEVSGGGITLVNLTAITFSVQDWYQSFIAPELSEDWVTTQAIGLDLTAVDGPSVTIAMGAAGGVEAEAAPNNVAACVSLRTANRGRSARGRNYLPAVPNSLIVLNTMDATFMANILAAYAMLIGPGTRLPGWQLVTVSRRNAGVERPTGVAFPVTSALFTRPTVSSMRSRSVGHGS